MWLFFLTAFIDNMPHQIKVGIIGGTGMDDPDILRNRREKTVVTPFGAPSDSLILGEVGDVPCVLLARHGRTHSTAPGNVNYRANIWALKEEGCTHIIASTATGSLKEELKPGDLVVLDSFIDRTQGRQQTFYDGSTLPGLCHMPMEPAFCEKLRQLILKTATEIGVPCHDRGTVVAIEGPRYSSKAESYMYRQWGGDVINMTSVPEICLAKEAGISYAAIALVTDYDCWRQTGENVSHGLVLETFAKNAPKIANLASSTIANIPKENWDDVIDENLDIVKQAIR